MKKLICSILLFAFVINISAIAQDKLSQDPKAKKILDAVSKKTKAYKTMKVSFTLTHEDQQNKTNDTRKGIIFLKGDKYKLIFAGTNTEITFDGKTLATYVIKDNEVTYSTPNLKDEETITPANIFTIYQKGFYYKLNTETPDANNHIIDLLPTKRDKKKYSRVRLKVSKTKSELTSIKSFGKDGQLFTIDITELVPDVVAPDNLFKFNEKNHPNLEIIDNRR